MRRKVGLFLLVWMLVVALCGVGYADTLDGYPKLLFPVKGDAKWQYLEGPSAHTPSVWDLSDLYALDLSGGGGEGTDVRPIALGVVEDDQ